MCRCHSILECCVTFSGVKLSIRSFVLFIIIISEPFVHLLPLIPDSQTSKGFCQVTDVSEDILCVSNSKDIVS